MRASDRPNGCEVATAPLAENTVDLRDGKCAKLVSYAGCSLLGSIVSQAQCDNRSCGTEMGMGIGIGIGGRDAPFRVDIGLLR